nr:hypothetical protein [Tanacetum cinerariifolium]
MSIDSELPPWGFHLVEANEPEALDKPKAPEAVPQSTDHAVPALVVQSQPELEEDLEIDPVDYPTDEEEEEESFLDEDEEEKHLAPADSAPPVSNSVPSNEKTKPFETDELQPPMAASLEELIAEYAFAPTHPLPPPSPLSPLSSPLPRIPSPPLLLPPTRPLHTSPTYASAPLCYRATMVQLRAASPSTDHPLLPSNIPSLPLPLPPPNHRDPIPEADMSPQKMTCFTAPSYRFKIRESSTAAAARQIGHAFARGVDYGFIDTLMLVFEPLMRE